MTYLIPAPLVFALLFVVASPTGDLVRPAEAGAAAGGTGGATPPVVMVLLDELPLVSLLNSQGEVDERVYPNFARLAETSHWYRNATGVGSFTSYAVPSMLSGRWPEKKLVPSYIQHPDNLFSFLAPDYRIRAFETITQLCDPAVCANTGGGRWRQGAERPVRPDLAGGQGPGQAVRRRRPDLRPVRRAVGRHRDDVEEGRRDDDGAEVEDAQGQPAGPVPAVRRRTAPARQADPELPAPAAAAPPVALPAVRGDPSGQAARGPQGRVGEPGLADGREPAGTAPAAGVHRPPARRGHRPPREARHLGRRHGRGHRRPR